MTKLRTLSAAVFTALALASIASAQTPGDPAPAPAPAPSPAPTPTPGAPAGSPAAPQAAQPGQPKPYKDVLKDAKAIPGFFTLHQKDEKVWIEILPDQFDKPFFFSYNIPRSIGERGLYGSQMGGSELAVFRKIGNQVQLIARNTEFFAPEGTPQATFVSESFSDSLLASAAVASAPHPETKAVVVEANALLFADIPGYLTRLETAFRMPFALDAKNTSISAASSVEHMTGIQVNAHFAVPKLAAPPLTPPPVPTPPPPKATPDPRSLFVGFQYSFAKLARRADARAPGGRARRLLHGLARRLRERHRGEAARPAREALADREEGSRGAGLGAPRSPSPTGSTRTFPRSTARPWPRACWSGTRPSRRRASATPSS